MPPCVLEQSATSAEVLKVPSWQLCTEVVALNWPERALSLALLALAVGLWVSKTQKEPYVVPT